jgi:hypothetical protein
LAALVEAVAEPLDHARLADLYEQRARLLDQQAANHDVLERRYAAAPKSLLAKRAHGWNTPGRQRELAVKARRDAEAARDFARQSRSEAGLTPR